MLYRLWTSTCLSPVGQTAAADVSWPRRVTVAYRRRSYHYVLFNPPLLILPALLEVSSATCIIFLINLSIGERDLQHLRTEFGAKLLTVRHSCLCTASRFLFGCLPSCTSSLSILSCGLSVRDKDSNADSVSLPN